MGFFDTIVNAADSFGAKVTGNVDAMGINSQVQAKEKEMNDLFAQLGAAYYSNHREDPEDACRNLVQLLINKEAELSKLKTDLATKKAETAAISYTQPQNSPAQNFGQPMNQQPMNQGFGQPMGQQPMNQDFSKPADSAPSAPAPLGPLSSMNDEPKKEEADKAGESEIKAENADTADKADTAEGKTCSVCGATGQSGSFCGQCGSKL